MLKSTWQCGSPDSLLGSSAAVRMCRLVLLLTTFAMNMLATSQAPPKLAACRSVAKARESGDYVFRTGETCINSIILPSWSQQNLTDPRSCHNFYRVQGMTVEMCPCPDGETFNPGSLICDSTSAPCECPVDSNTPTTTPTTTPRTPSPSTSHMEVVIADSTTINGKVVLTTSSKDLSRVGNLGGKSPPVSSEVIIIAGIISATVIIIVVIVMGVFCWQKRHAARQQSVERGTSKKLSTLQHDGYSHSMAPTERHEYAEIDEGIIGGKHWQHRSSLRAPPLPNHQPPMSPTFNGSCPHHDRSDSGLGSADTSFTVNYPKRTFQPINPARTIQIGVAYNERSSHTNSANTCPHHCTNDELYSDQDDAGTSSDSHCSQCSSSGHPALAESREIDLRAPIHTCKQNYVSKQVYI